MITICDGIDGVKLIKEDERNVYSININERVILQPRELRRLILPYKRLDLKNGKFYNFVLNKNLVVLGLNCHYSNLNDLSSLDNLEFVIKNTNMDINPDVLSRVVGSRFRIDLLSGSLFGKIFC
jgi:hypothetical protein